MCTRAPKETCYACDENGQIEKQHTCYGNSSTKDICNGKYVSHHQSDPHTTYWKEKCPFCKGTKKREGDCDFIEVGTTHGGLATIEKCRYCGQRVESHCDNYYYRRPI